MKAVQVHPGSIFCGLGGVKNKPQNYLAGFLTIKISETSFSGEHPGIEEPEDLKGQEHWEILRARGRGGGPVHAPSWCTSLTLK